MPIFKELNHWWKLKNKVYQKKRIWLWCIFLICSMGLLFFPWRSHISIPGVLTSATYASIYAAEPAQIVSIDIKRGQKVAKDQVLWF